MDTKKFTQLKSPKFIIGILILIAVIFGIFQAGVFVGFQKASFLFKYGDNYYRTFGERGNMPPFRDEMAGGHGVIGKIVRINLPTIVVMGPDNIEKIIVTTASTTVHQFREAFPLNKLTADQFITVLGYPNEQGQIVARFIRLMPVPGQK
jgi:hypothetical protein